MNITEIYLSKGQVKEAIGTISDEREKVQLLGRYNTLMREQRMGIISREVYNLELNNIKVAIGGNLINYTTQMEFKLETPRIEELVNELRNLKQRARINSSQIDEVNQLKQTFLKEVGRNIDEPDHDIQAERFQEKIEEINKCISSEEKSDWANVRNKINLFIDTTNLTKEDIEKVFKLVISSGRGSDDVKQFLKVIEYAPINEYLMKESKRILLKLLK